MSIQYYQKIISCFLEDIDPIIKIFKHCLRIAWRSVPVSSNLLFGISEILKLPKIINESESGLFMICLNILVSPKINTIGFGT